MKVLEDIIDKAGDDLTEYAHTHASKIWYQIALSIALLFIFIVGAGWLVGIKFKVWWYIGFWISTIAGMSVVFVAMLGDFIAFLNRISVYDQAVTTLGFVLAACGMIIELLQLFNIV